MFDQLLEIQALLQTMRDALRKGGSVIPREIDRITIPEAKLDVLWFLDRLAAEVAGAIWHDA